MLFQFAHIRVHVGVVARHGFGQCIDRAGAALAQRLQQVDAQEVLVKAKLAGKIGDIIKRQNLTRQQAAAVPWRAG